MRKLSTACANASSDSIPYWLSRCISKYSSALSERRTGDVDCASKVVLDICTSRRSLTAPCQRGKSDVDRVWPLLRNQAIMPISRLMTTCSAMVDANSAGARQGPHPEVDEDHVTADSGSVLGPNINVSSPQPRGTQRIGAAPQGVLIEPTSGKSRRLVGAVPVHSVWLVAPSVATRVVVERALAPVRVPWGPPLVGHLRRKSCEARNSQTGRRSCRRRQARWRPAPCAHGCSLVARAKQRMTSSASAGTPARRRRRAPPISRSRNRRITGGARARISRLVFCRSAINSGADPAR